MGIREKDIVNMILNLLDTSKRMTSEYDAPEKEIEKYKKEFADRLQRYQETESIADQLHTKYGRSERKKMESGLDDFVLNRHETKRNVPRTHRDSESRSFALSQNDYVWDICGSDNSCEYSSHYSNEYKRGS